MKIDKISFLSADEKDLSCLFEALSELEREESLRIVNHYISVDGGFSFAFSFSHGSLLVRVFDGEEYFFAYPYEICENADIGAAIEDSVRYASLEEIEPIFAGVPLGEVGIFFSLGFSHINADSDGSDTYRIILKNECSLVSESLGACEGDLSLSALCKGDEEAYARLCRDEENNKYWGYDFSEDYEGCEDSFFLELASRDFLSSSALSLAVRHNGALIGEALLSCFDYKGGADVSLRILPEHQKSGYGKRALQLLFEVAEKMGLSYLWARVYEENLPSVALFSKNADERLSENGIVTFRYDLT